jgi:hypothetical protein
MPPKMAAILHRRWRNRVIDFQIALAHYADRKSLEEFVRCKPLL